jgi:hypothetical protein
MTGEPSDFDPQTLWQSQATEYDPMTLADIHQKSRAFERKIRRRNHVEYLASALVVVGFGAVAADSESWMIQLGAVLTIFAALFVAWQLHRRGSARRVPDIGQDLVAFHREELVRQRDALRSIGRWYLAPFVPGAAMVMLGRWFQAHVEGRSVALDHLIIALASVIVALVFLAVWQLNRRGADRLQRRIDEL